MHVTAASSPRYNTSTILLPACMHSSMTSPCNTLTGGYIGTVLYENILDYSTFAIRNDLAQLTTFEEFEDTATGILQKAAIPKEKWQQWSQSWGFPKARKTSEEMRQLVEEEYQNICNRPQRP